MVHTFKLKKNSILTKENKEEYKKGFEKGFSGKDMGFFKSSYYQEGWNEGMIHRRVLEIDELKALRNKMYKKHKR